MRILALGLLLLAGAAAAQVQSDWERENEERLKQSEEVVVAPPPLERASLIELQLEVPTDFRYFVDATSVSVGPDRIVRYTMLARSPSGVENITFEGLRCAGEFRVYSVALPGDRGWSGRPGEWRPVPRDARVGQNALMRRYFCPARNTAIRDAKEGVAALQAGRHPAKELEQY